MANNQAFWIKDAGGTSREMLSIHSDDHVIIALNAQGPIYLGYGASTDNPINIKVNGVDAANLTVGAADSGGTGYRVLRVPNGS
jgi:hypothetical protein